MGCIDSKPSSSSSSNEFGHIEDSMHARIKKSIMKGNGKPAAFVPRKEMKPPGEAEANPQPDESR
eukprot:CAMPEP_0194074724 /NCGR_PEP_ID=MMETSP0149-20130528/1819_1 /TAXON_ID=122233 /ORGANISM="Chaetoceros debilis, Strain MM31A-1" /LENGTH=64 /DNA_ID=CAMNT_0038754989 /DNA_START=239 /DNA_END=433 /DNA_ORIENTATION=+